MILNRRNTEKEVQSTLFEALAVVFNLLFTWLYLNGSDWCFLFGILGPLFLARVCFSKKLYAETALQVIYIGTAILGFYQIGNNWTPQYLHLSQHIAIISSGLILTIILGFILTKKTKAALPYLDSFTTIYGVLATVLMMFFIREAFLYFIIINSVSIVMYTMRKMYFGAFMFLVYLLMSIDGYFQFSWFS